MWCLYLLLLLLLLTGHPASSRQTPLPRTGAPTETADSPTSPSDFRKGGNLNLFRRALGIFNDVYFSESVSLEEDQVAEGSGEEDRTGGRETAEEGET